MKRISSVVPWILLIISVTAFAVIARYISIENEEHNKVVAELQAKNVNLQGTADYFQKEIDSYSEKPNEWQGVIDGLLEQLQAVYSADAKALDTLALDLFMKGSEKIAKNDYSNFPEYKRRKWDAGVTEPLEITVDGFKYTMRNDASFWTDHNEYSDTFTGELLDKVLDKRFAEIDGYLYVREIKTGIPEWGAVNAKLTRVSESDDEIKYSVTYDRQENGKITDRNLTCTVTIKYEDGRYKISQTDFDNL